MLFEPIQPVVGYPPLKVADDTWLIQQRRLDERSHPHR